MVVTVPNAPDVPETSKMLEDVDNVSIAAPLAACSNAVMLSWFSQITLFSQTHVRFSLGTGWCSFSWIDFNHIFCLFFLFIIILFILSYFNLTILCGCCLLIIRCLILTNPMAGIILICITGLCVLILDLVVTFAFFFGSGFFAFHLLPPLVSLQFLWPPIACPPAHLIPPIQLPLSSLKDP